MTQTGSGNSPPTTPAVCKFCRSLAVFRVAASLTPTATAGLLRASSVERCVPVASLYGRLWTACYGKAGIPCCVATSPVRFIPSDAIQSLHTVFPIVLKLRILQITSAGSFNCRFLVLSFSQVLTLNICYTLKQPAEIFAAFRTGSWKKRPKIQ